MSGLRTIPRDAWLIVLWVACAGIVFGSAFFGSTHVSIDSSIFRDYRVPRALLAAAAGAGLAAAGVVLQTLFRNPLAEPYTIGVSSGAALGAALGYFFKFPDTLRIGPLDVPQLPVVAFGGAAVAVSLVMLMARLRPRRDMTYILLAGVCVSYSCAAGVMLIQYFADRTINDYIVRWMVGSVEALQPRAWVQVLGVFSLLFLYLLYAHRDFDLLALGDDVAAARGVAVGRVVWISFALVGLLTAVIVANCGPLAFIGLIIPNITRAIFGPATRLLLLASVALGAAFLAASDAFARSLLSWIYGSAGGHELPVGLVTQIVGAAFLFGLLLRSPRVTGR